MAASSASACILLRLKTHGMKHQSDEPASRQRPRTKKIGRYPLIDSKIVRQMGGPASCRIPFTKSEIPYELVSRSAPSMSAMTIAVMPTYVPVASPKIEQSTLTHQ